MCITKVIIVLLCAIGTQWFPAFIIAAAIYLLVVRGGSELLGYWLFKDRNSDKWD